jgi:hypothetical protein
MHYRVLVVLDKEDSNGAFTEHFRDEALIQKAVTESLSRYEDVEWDWWQIGGRWTGYFDGFDPMTDPANLDEKGKAKWPTEWRRHAGDYLPVNDLTEKHMQGANAFCIDQTWHGGKDYFPWLGDRRWRPLRRKAQAWLRGHQYPRLEKLFNAWTSVDFTKMFVEREQPPLAWLKHDYQDGLVVIVDCHN